MAKAVDFREFTPGNTRDDLVRRVEQAPIEHTEAILASYDLLQSLYDKGVINVLNGLLSAGDAVIERVTDVVSSPQAVTAFRTALILGNLFTSINPDGLHEVIRSVEKDEPPSLFAIAKQANSSDARRAMAIVVGLLRVLGSAANAKDKVESPQ